MLLSANNKLLLVRRFCSDKCSKESQRKAERPTKDKLLILVWEKPTTLIAKDFGVTDKTIEKWCNAYGINKPPRGYWTRRTIKCRV